MSMVKEMRTLAIAAGAFSAAVFAANYILPDSLTVPFALGCMLAGLLLFRSEKRPLRAARITLLALSVGLLCCFIHTRRTVVPAAELSGETMEITAEVTDLPTSSGNFDSVELKLSMDGMPRLRLLLYDYGRTLSGLRPGQTVRLTAKIRRADVRYDERYDYSISNGIYLTATARSEITVVGETFTLRLIPALIRRTVSNAIERIFPADTAPFMKALMTGDRTEYNRDLALKTSMSYAGFAHMIAVSGMHVAFLVGFVVLIFGKGRITSLVCAALVWLFVFAAGSPPSAVRAGVMQTMLLAAPMVRRENDAPTSLSAALALILAINPFAARSVSLQLSFAAMAGLLCFGEKLFSAMTARVKNKRARRMLSYPMAAAASSLAVMAFTAPLTAAYFGYLSLLTPITSVLSMWAVSVCFCGGYAACLLSVFPLVGGAAAWIVSLFARYIFLVARAACAVPHSVVFFENRHNIAWLILTYALVLWALIGEKRRARRVILAISFSAVTLAAALYIPYRSYRSGVGTFAAVNVGQGQSIAVLAGDRTVLIDCGATGARRNAGETAASYLRSRGREKVDLLLLTHLHSDHANGVAALMELVPVDTLVLPENCGDSDGTLTEILECAARRGTRVVKLTEDTSVTCGEITGTLYAPVSDGDGNEQCITAKISVRDYDMIVTADISAEAEKALMERHSISGAELLIVGHHGSRYSSCEEFLSAIGADTAVISVGYNTYGHPADEVLERLNDCGYNVYRTDIDGTVEIRIG